MPLVSTDIYEFACDETICTYQLCYLYIETERFELEKTLIPFWSTSPFSPNVNMNIV